MTTMASVSGGDPGVPTRSASGLETSGAARQQAGEGRDERQEQVFGEEGRRDQARRAAGGLQESDPAGAFRQAAADEDRHAGEREHAEQRGAGKEEGLVGAQEGGVPVGDLGP
jgi:hypothetical protein